MFQLKIRAINNSSTLIIFLLFIILVSSQTSLLFSSPLNNKNKKSNEEIIEPEIEIKDYYKELSENVNLFFNVYRQLNNRYIDSIETEKFFKTGIKAMLKSLDPYTVLLESDQKTHYDELNTGTYGGIGIYVGLSGEEKRLTVISPIDDTPASKVGLRAGDKIMFIDEMDTYGIDTSEASKFLKGDEGTKVNLKIKRFGEKDFLNFEITRENIVISNIPYSSILEDEFAYIKVSQFAKKTVNEIKSKLTELLIGNKVSGIILDLRYNPGGLLSSAVDMSNLFLDKNLEIVSTKGKKGKIISQFTTKNDKFTDLPLVVLINESSASASEIVAGALQDYDRAVIIGADSYGKGLVQQIYNTGNDKSIKITIAKYYTPSGRLIQKKDYFNNSGRDSNSETAMVDTVDFATLTNKRTVKSGIGIYPDIVIDKHKYSPYFLSLKMKNIFNNFTYEFKEKNPDYQIFADNNLISNTILNDFKQYLDTLNFKYNGNNEEQITNLIETYQDTTDNFVLAKTDDEIDFDQVIITKLNDIKTLITNEKQKDFDKNISEIKKALLIEFSILEKGNSEKYRITTIADPQVLKGIEILKNEKIYSEILGNEE